MLLSFNHTITIDEQLFPIKHSGTLLTKQYNEPDFFPLILLHIWLVSLEIQSLWCQLHVCTAIKK